MTLQTADFDYHLPEELIAQHPCAERDASRLLVLHGKQKQMEHTHFHHITDYLQPGDCLVLNDTRVIPARLYGHKQTGGHVEFLLTEQIAPNEWHGLMKTSRRPPPGTLIDLEQDAKAEIIQYLDSGNVHICIHSNMDMETLLNRIGIMPLPPYIRRPQQEEADKERYQTVYSKTPGAVAAPTAGLHFTPAIFDALEAKGVKKTFVTLHVGIGTFRPVKAASLQDHTMHEERFEINEEAAQTIRETQQNGGRIVAVGSTSVRTLETVMQQHGRITACRGRSSIFIYPPHTFQCVDALITNFHLPCSTLLMMIAAFAGHDFVMQAYAEAVRERYRFFSYGDCMFID